MQHASMTEQPTNILNFKKLLTVHLMLYKPKLKNGKN